MLVLVVPCYNEAARLDLPAFRAWLGEQRGSSLLFVDDGSTDDTAALLAGLVDFSPQCCSLLRLPVNVGKAEAVRAGLQAALAQRADLVGYWDADLATPLTAVADFLRVLEDSAVEVVTGARVALVGRSIKRSLRRHYLGRVFATLASNILDLPVYDTQCGAKLFRATPHLAAALSQPFRCRWTFDVELLARFMLLKQGQLGQCMVELPLRQWTDVAGSKLGVRGIARMAFELLDVGVTYRLRRDFTPLQAPAAELQRARSPRARARTKQ